MPIPARSVSQSSPEPGTRVAKSQVTLAQQILNNKEKRAREKKNTLLHTPDLGETKTDTRDKLLPVHVLWATFLGKPPQNRIARSAAKGASGRF